MQALAPPTGAHNPNGKTAAMVLAALQGATGTRRLTFRYDLLDSGNAYLQALDCVLSCKIEENWLADIKRKATFGLVETGEINFLSDRIQPWIRLWLYPFGDNDYVEWPQGVFLLNTPPRHSDAVGQVTRGVSGFDLLQALNDDKVNTRYTVAAAAVVTTAISALLVGYTASVIPSTAVTTTASEWEPGTSKLKIVNELLNMINYNSLSFDENGTALVSPYVAPTGRAEEYTYADDQSGLIIPEVDQELDLYDIANQWTMVVSEPDQPLLTSTYTNNDPGSPTSTVRRGRTITDFRTQQDAVSQAVLDAKVARLAFEASQVYEAIAFETALMPIHSGNDVYRITYSDLAINARYTEQSWEMTLEAGAPMKHRARRVVTIS